MERRERELDRERHREAERERDFLFHSLILVCALTKNRTHNHGVSG